MKLSVVIPTRNRLEALVACLRLLEAQTFPRGDYEIIVTDDGDAAKTGAALAAEFPGVRVVAGPGRGPASNRNAGAQFASGEWVVFTDDDTLPDRGWLSAISAASAGVDVVEGRTVCNAGLHSPRDHAPINETGGWWWSCNIAFRHEAFDRLGGFDERFRIPHMEDVDLRERARAAGLAWRFAANAVVDHPPRRERWGTAWGPIHRAELLYAAIHRQPPRLVRTLVNTARVRLRSISRAPFSVDGMSAAVSTVVELAHTLLRWSAWKAEARMAAEPR